VVSDIGMPDAGGLDLIARIRKSGGAARDVAAIAMSAHARAEDRAEALAAGFQDYLVKPVDSARLIEAVMRAARNGGISGPMAGPMAVEELSPPPEGVAADA
jgi:CheY-like chemotaxis protein